MKKFKFFLIFFVSISFPIIVQANEADTGLRKPRLSETDLLSRIERLEKGMNVMHKQVYAEPKAPSLVPVTNNEAANAQFDELYQQLKIMRGEIEQLQFENSKLKEQLERFSSDVEFRLNELSQNKVAQLSTPPSNIQNTAPKDLLDNREQQPPAAHSNSTDSAYKEALALYQAKDYVKAAQAFQTFINKNPDHNLVGSAYYWLGEIHSQNSKYEDAAIRYLKGYQFNTNGIKAQDNLFKLASSLAKLNKNKEACITFSKLKREFPNLTSSISQQVEEQLLRLNCQ